jgi:hypothetical protein
MSRVQKSLLTPVNAKQMLHTALEAAKAEIVVFLDNVWDGEIINGFVPSKVRKPPLAVLSLQNLYTQMLASGLASHGKDTSSQCKLGAEVSLQASLSLMLHGNVHLGPPSGRWGCVALEVARRASL